MNSMVANQVYKAYHRASHTVAKTKQIVMLYDGALRFLAQAREATERNDIETRYNRLVRVSEIIVGLQASLDFEAGGRIANVLYDFYADVELQIFNLHQGAELAQYDALIKELREMRDSWAMVDEQEASARAETAATSDSNDVALEAPVSPAPGSNISA